MAKSDNISSFGLSRLPLAGDFGDFGDFAAFGLFALLAEAVSDTAFGDLFGDLGNFGLYFGEEAIFSFNFLARARRAASIFFFLSSSDLALFSLSIFFLSHIKANSSSFFFSFLVTAAFASSLRLSSLILIFSSVSLFFFASSSFCFSIRTSFSRLLSASSFSLSFLALRYIASCFFRSSSSILLISSSRSFFFFSSSSFRLRYILIFSFRFFLSIPSLFASSSFLALLSCSLLISSSLRLRSASFFFSF
mmetsp:Transcript_2175/g.3992  ORF Transcript_2175/g.3992 Transcript_2175/m.3992 type:complete len:250 (-) Transcript_2175:546-1295(-)